MAKIVLSEPSRAVAEFRLLPGLTTTASAVDKISLATRLARTDSSNSCLKLNIPLTAAAMQSVSGVRLGIELARHGGLAFIYSSQAIEQQSEMIRRIKSHKAGFVKPRTVLPDMPLREVAALASREGFSTFPVVDSDGKLLGLLTRNDFAADRHGDLPAQQRMVHSDHLVVGNDNISLRQANDLLMESHQSVLPVVDAEYRLCYLVFRKDIESHLDNPNEVVDAQKRLAAAAAINTHDYKQRVPELAAAETDVIVIDSSDGHSCYQGETIAWCCREFPKLPVIAGNIVTADGFRYLAEAGAAAVKIGMGGGSICITQEQKGTGRGLGTAICDVAAARDEWFERTGNYLPLIADGGIVTAKDMVIALALGADSIMLGRYFARLEESPTEKVIINNRVMKPYWGEGSARARDWRGSRYNQAVFAEGVEGYVEYAGSLKDNLTETLAILRSSFASAGAANVEELHKNAVLEVVSALSIREGQAHDILMPGQNSAYTGNNWGV